MYGYLALDVEQITMVSPGGTAPIVAGVRFGLKASEAVGIMGPRGAGKNFAGAPPPEPKAATPLRPRAA